MSRGIFGLLKGVGNRLGLVRVVEVADAARPEKVTTRTVALRDLVAEVRAEEVRALAELPAELSVEFARVFEAAGVKVGPHGWGVERLGQLLGTEQYKAMDRPAAQKAVLGVLASDKAPVDDVVKDAVARDQALDAYAAFVGQKMAAREAARRRRAGAIEEQVRQLREEAARLDEEAKADQERLKAWRLKKQAYEREMAVAINYVLDKPVVSVEEV